MKANLASKVTPKPESAEIEIEGEIPADLFMGYRQRVLTDFNRDAAIDGFRAGHVPENVLVSHVGEEKILFRMAQEALAEHYPQLLTEHKIDAIGQPQITITKIAKDNPLGFKIVTAILPKITLPDYQKIAASINKEPLPEIKEEDKEKEKFERWKQRDKRRLEIIEAIIKEVEVKLPETLINAELNKMLVELKTEIEATGLKFADYLAHIKKTEEELQSVWRTQAEKRAKIGLVLVEIAAKEKIAPPDEQIEAETKKLIERYPKASPQNIRHYVIEILTNEAVWQFLEGQK